MFDEMLVNIIYLVQNSPLLILSHCVFDVGCAELEEEGDHEFQLDSFRKICCKCQTNKDLNQQGSKKLVFKVHNDNDEDENDNAESTILIL